MFTASCHTDVQMRCLTLMRANASEPGLCEALKLCFEIFLAARGQT